MKASASKHVGLLAIVLLIVSCTSREMNPTAYQQWYWSSKSDSHVARTVNGVELKASYEPNVLRAYSEHSDDPTINTDSLYRKMSDNMVFRLQLKSEVHNLLRVKVNSQQAFDERIYKLSYGMNEHFYIKDKSDKKVEPVGVQFENRDGFDGSICFTVLFNVKELSERSHISLCFDDPLWGTGMHKFVYDIEKIERYKIVE